MAVDLDAREIDPADAKYASMLQNLQGNILKSHGRNYASLLFLKFKPRHEVAAAQFIRTFADQVTSARKQLGEAKAYTEALKAQRTYVGPLFANFLLSAAGYRYFRFQNSQIPPDPRFRAGMKAWAEHLQDRPQNWDAEYKEQIHAMILLAGDGSRSLKRRESEVALDAGKVAHVLSRQSAKMKRNKTKDAIEHVGFVDGASNPLFFKGDIDEAKQHGIDLFDPAAPLNLVLVSDPPDGSMQDSFGSYLVLRKLEQDVKAFKQAQRQLIRILGLKGADTERAGAMVMGRFKDGTPLADAETAQGGRDPIPNNFNYFKDRDGMKCPFQGHIRKMNTRRPYEEERSRRVARRGITYGKEKGSKGVGLLFMCFQSDIEHQFEWLQMTGGNDRNFPMRGAGLDPLIGQGPSAAQEWPVRYDGQSGTKALDIRALTSVKGGEYFFAPSMGFLKAFAPPLR